MYWNIINFRAIGVFILILILGQLCLIPPVLAANKKDAFRVESHSSYVLREMDYRYNQDYREVLELLKKRFKSSYKRVYYNLQIPRMHSVYQVPYEWDVNLLSFLLKMKKFYVKKYQPEEFDFQDFMLYVYYAVDKYEELDRRVSSSAIKQANLIK